jgi:hypothetical protein
MSEQNVELGRCATDAFDASIDAFIAYCDPSIEMHSTTAVGGAVYHGRDGLRVWQRDLGDTWAEIRLKPEAFFDVGQQVLVFYVLKAHAHRADALADLGVSEDEFEPIAP